MVVEWYVSVAGLKLCDHCCGCCETSIFGEAGVNFLCLASEFEWYTDLIDHIKKILHNHFIKYVR